MADADDADGLAVNCKGRHAAVDIRPAVVAHVAVHLRQPTVDAQNQGEGVFGHVDCIRATVIGERNRQFCQQIQRHPLESGAYKLHQP